MRCRYFLDVSSKNNPQAETNTNLIYFIDIGLHGSVIDSYVMCEYNLMIEK